MSRFLILSFTTMVLLFLACQSKTDSTKSIPPDEPQTALFLNIDVPKISTAIRPFFSDLDRYGYQAKSEPGSASGFMAMKGRKFQRFQISGTITEAGRAKLFSKLKSDLKTIVEEHGAKIIGEIDERVRDRPIWYLSMILPSTSKVDLANLEGFYFEYADQSGNGFVDVMAAKKVTDEETEIWHFGFAIHEPHDMK